MADADRAGISLDAQALWAKHEDIAMHFNDLLMRLRSQSLAGIAAVSTLVGLFTKEGISNIHLSWEVATAIFIAMASFWISIWCLDFLYYNRLLIGAVSAITKLEHDIISGEVHGIQMSIAIEDEFKRSAWRKGQNSFRGVLLFYIIVLIVILGGAGGSAYMLCRHHDERHSPPSGSSATSPTSTFSYRQRINAPSVASLKHP